MKKLPSRTCIGCNEKKLKKELIRIVKNSNAEVAVDKTGKMPGRGAYICNNIECLKKAVNSKRLERSFEMKIENEIYNELQKQIQEL